jgi:hypothetical protein
VNDTAWEAISIARQCAKEDITDFVGNVAFAFFVIHPAGGKGKSKQNTKSIFQNSGCRCSR